MKKTKSTLIVVCIAIILSCLFAYVPGLNKVSVGFTIIICAVVASVIGAIFFPIDDTEEEEEDEE